MKSSDINIERQEMSGSIFIALESFHSVKCAFSPRWKMSRGKQKSCSDKANETV